MSALTSLLVRDQVVPVRKIEEALQRQVVSGGDVETILLESDALPEDVLSAYRAAVFGKEPGTRDAVMRASRDVVRLVPKEVAERERIVPIAREGRTLVLAAAQPLSTEADQQLGFLLGHDLAVQIVSEVRIAAALAMHYGVEATPRLARLAERLATRDPGVAPMVAPPELTGAHNLPSKRRAAIFDDDDDEESDDWGEGEQTDVAPAASMPEPEERSTRPFGFQVVPEERGRPVPEERGRPVPEERGRPAPEERATMPGPAARASQRAAAAAPEAAPPAVLVAAEVLEAGRDAAPPPPAPTTPGRTRAPKPSVKMRGPLVLDQAMELLRTATARDQVLDVFFTFARQFFDYSALFVVGDDQAEGRESYGSGAPTSELVRVAVPLDQGLFADVRRDGVLRVGKLDATAADRTVAQRLGREPSSTVAIVPLLIRSRVVLLLYGDRGGEAFGLHDVPELLGVLPRVSEAFERLIMQKKGKFGAGDASARGQLKAAAAEAAPKLSQRPPAGAAFSKGGGQGEGAISKRMSAAPPAPASVRPAATAAAPASVRPAVSASAPAPAPTPAPPAAAPTPEPEPTQRDTIVDGIPVAGRIADVVAPSAAVVPARLRRGEGSPLSVLGVPRSAPPPPMPRRAPSGVMKAQSIAEPLPPPRLPAELAAPAAPAEPEDDADPSGPTTLPAPPPAHDDEPEMTVESSPAGDDDEPEMTVESGPADDGELDGIEEELTPAARPARKPQRGIGNYAMHIGTEERIGPVSTTAVKLEKDTRPDTPRARTSLRPPRDEPKVIVDMGETVEAVVVDLMRSPPDDTTTPARLVRLGETSLPVIVQSFPGPLWFDRHAPHTRLPRGRDVSATARTLVLFGDKAVPYVSSLLSARDADTRFYATLVAAELPNAGLVPALGARIFDEDQGTRALVLDVLKVFSRYAGIREVLDRVRSTARAPDKDAPTRRIAIRALAELRDSRAVPLLVKLLEGADPALGREAHRALVTLTRMDLGESAKKWDAWLERNEARHRIEWLIDALLSDDEQHRAAAGDELQRTTQEYYGFHAGSPKKDRERVHKKYRDWWDSEGKKKFGV